jgi:hypothetical protein
MDLVAERIAGPFEMPWSVGLLPDGSFLVTERPGRLQHVTQTAGTYAVDGVPPVLYSGHGGLLDVAVDPNFEENGMIYLSYLQGEETASIIKVMRARFDADQEALTEQQVIFEGSPGTRPELLGGRIALTGDGYLFLSLGDRWDAAKAQDLSGTAGTIVRIRSDGSIPEDNPFRTVEGRARRSGATAIAIRRGLPSTRSRASSGPTSMARKAATSSISFTGAGITAGRSQRSGSTIPVARSRSTARNRAPSCQYAIGCRFRSLQAH